MKAVVERQETQGTPISADKGPSRKFSYEVHGIRGLALTMGVAFHLFGHGKVSGGVDVFLVISAYLMTGSILKAVAKGHLSLVHRYGRTFSRLLPAALLTILASLGMSLLVLPQTRLLTTFEEGQAAAVFGENIYLATKGMAYEAAGRDASPFQHFWSLSMQGQFLLLWPLVAFLLIYGLKNLTSALKTKLFLAITLTVTGASFAYAIHAVSVDQQVAYYSLLARLWEFGLGSLAAFFTSKMGRYAKSGGWLGWAGVALILSSGFVVDGATTFPVPSALWPVSGAMLVLFAADSGGAGRLGLTKTLSFPPIVWLANRGYPLYLWHWPVLVFFLAFQGQDRIGYNGALVVLLVSLLLSEGTIRLISAPFTQWSNRLQTTAKGQWFVLGTIVGSAAVVALVAHAGVIYQQRIARIELAQAREAVEVVIAMEKADKSVGLPSYDPTQPLIPSPLAAVEDLPDIYSMGCVQGTRNTLEMSEVLVCPDSPGTLSKGAQSRTDKPRVVLSGGSHAAQFYPDLRRLADEEGWELFVVEKSGCRLAVGAEDTFNTEACWRWNQRASDVILDLEPDLVVTLGSVTDGVVEGVEKAHHRQVDAWKHFTDAGVPVVAMRDTPRFPHNVPGCLTQTDDPADCGVLRSTVYQDVSPLNDFALPDLVTEIDLSHKFCDEAFCPAVIGNIVSYRDASHVSATFAETLAPSIKAALRPAMPELFISK